MCKSKFLIVALITVFVSKTLQLTINCEYKNSSTISNGSGVWKTVLDPYACVVETLDIISKLLVTNVTGTHVDRYTNDDVQALIIVGGQIIKSYENTDRDEVRSSCEIIPSGFGTVYPNIKALSIAQANLKTVSSGDLKQFTNLREIWLDDNRLEFLESKLFQFNPNVELISFVENRIRYIGANFFDYLPKLVDAFFYYNKCIDEAASVGAELDPLKQKIKEKCFVSETSSSLELTVECQYRISSDWEVVKDSYECDLVSFDITSKLLATNATGTHLSGHKNNDVKAITIYDGICHIIPSALGSIFPNIEVLAIRNTGLKIVSRSDLQQFSNLREIWLLGNDVYALDSNLFEYNPRVEIVIVKGNKIQYVGGKFFDFLPNLQKVDFSDNECIDEKVSKTIKVSDIKEKIKQKCDVPGTEFTRLTTIRPDGLFYWTWRNITIDDQYGLGAIAEVELVDWKVTTSLIG